MQGFSRHDLVTDNITGWWRERPPDRRCPASRTVRLAMTDCAARVGAPTATTSDEATAHPVEVHHSWTRR